MSEGERSREKKIKEVMRMLKTTKQIRDSNRREQIVFLKQSILLFALFLSLSLSPSFSSSLSLFLSFSFFLSFPLSFPLSLSFFKIVICKCICFHIHQHVRSIAMYFSSHFFSSLFLPDLIQLKMEADYILVLYTCMISTYGTIPTYSSKGDQQSLSYMKS